MCEPIEMSDLRNDTKEENIKSAIRFITLIKSNEYLSKKAYVSGIIEDITTMIEDMKKDNHNSFLR